MWWQSFSIVFGLGLLSFIVACPMKCKCTWYRRNKHANVHCRSRNLTEIPHGIPRQTVLLDLQNNNLRYIKPKAFEHLTNLKSLLLMGTNLKNLSADAFAGLQNLRELTLTNNRIATLEMGFFQIFDEVAIPWYWEQRDKSNRSIHVSWIRSVENDVATQ